ncbi:hypothetical protein HK405_015843 [Cladochytrium tenue]|nr:hypothetical protein HK405_015843 [Cladochytrium tenue]
MPAYPKLLLPPTRCYGAVADAGASTTLRSAASAILPSTSSAVVSAPARPLSVRSHSSLPAASVFLQPRARQTSPARHAPILLSPAITQCFDGPTVPGNLLRRRGLSGGTSQSHAKQEPSRTRAIVAAGGGLLAILVAYTISTSYRSSGSIEGATPTSDPSPSPAEATAETADTRDPTLPRFRLADIRTQHGPGSEQPWVTHEDKVYDITDWVSAHPGGDVILRAAGGSIEPYWKIFSIHNQPHVREILSQYLVGLVDVADLGEGGRPRAEQVEDPFVDDPARDARLATHTLKPRNAEPPAGELLKSFVTPNELFYVRNHMWVPVVGSGASGAADGGDAHVLTVELPDGDVREYTVGELKSRFPVHRVTAVMQCSGNRRADMTRNAAKTNGLQWGVGAISNAVWEGVRLADVLADAGLQVGGPGTATAAGRVGDGQNGSSLDGRTHHVQFTGLEAYGSSIPLAKAVDPRGDVLLAFGMNGDVLPRDHGYPLRAVVPGHVAARSVKWLSKVVVSEEESYSQWQRRDYKCFGPNEGANPDWDRAPAIQELPVTSAITGVWVGEDVRKGHVPWPARAAVAEETSGGAEEERRRQQQQQSEAEPIALQGYAYSGGGREVTRVDVSVDGGRTWDQAKLVGGDDDDGDSGSAAPRGNGHWAWKFWRYEGLLPASVTSGNSSSSSSSDGKDGGAQGEGQRCTTLVVKATDETYGSQPETHAGIYNVRGNLATAWHRVRVCPRCERPGGPGGGSGSSSSSGAAVWTTGAVFGCGFQTEEAARETAAK